MRVSLLPLIVRKSFPRLWHEAAFRPESFLQTPSNSQPRIFLGLKHVKDFGLTGNDDEAIWQLASEQSFVIVSKDSDFLHRSLLRGHPPKVIQLRVGNCSTHHIHELFHS